MLKSSKLAAAAMTGGLALGTFTLGLAPAQADEPHKTLVSQSSQTFKNEAYGDCMDDWDGRLWARSCDGSNEQEWNVHQWADGTVRLRNVDTGACLDDTGGSLGTSSSCTMSEYQSFYVTRWGDGTIRFKSEATGDCVDVDSDGDIGTRRCDTSESQSWY